jgi:hypothetical protein
MVIAGVSSEIRIDHPSARKNMLLDSAPWKELVRPAVGQLVVTSVAVCSLFLQRSASSLEKSVVRILVKGTEESLLG